MEILLVGLGESSFTVVDPLLVTRGHAHTLAQTGEDGLAALARPFPYIVVEAPLVDMGPSEFCRRARATAHGADAVILVIISADQDLGPVLEAGATDLYFTSLGPSALETRLLIGERLVAKQLELRGREARFRRLFESGVAGVTIADLDGNFKEANAAFLSMLGYSRDEMLAGRLSWSVITPPDWLVPDTEAREQLRSTGFLPLREREYVHKAGHHVSALVGAAMLADTGEFVTYVTDLTEKKRGEAVLHRMEEQLRQAQKMEAIGNLAAGVSHDFNNLLSVILSYSELLGTDLKEADPMRVELREIHAAGLRAADLTRQLLAFSRQQVMRPSVVDLVEIIGGMESMLRRLIGEDIELCMLTAAATLEKVLVDVGQVEQVILNLVVNARDAMPRGGKLTIETSLVVLDASNLHAGASAGPHVMLAVTDTGIGMDRATQARIFEPFFTTKEIGKGTGLGLATVFGIVKQSGGSLYVDSSTNGGTTFKLFFPVGHPAAFVRALPLPPAQSRQLAGTETILLVEDDAAVRSLATTILRKYGYTVLEAQSGGDALLLCEQYEAMIDLLVTDVVMPRMSGRQLAELLQKVRSEMKVLYLSGYTDDAVIRHGVVDSSIAFLQKPITPEPLARKVREVLDGAGRMPWLTAAATA